MNCIRFLIVVVLAFIFVGCSWGGGNPILPIDNTNETALKAGDKFTPTIASDVLYTSFSSDTAYKAFGIFQVILDPKSLTAEVVPTRKAQAIGTTFDADLTQFLTVSPCRNCLKIDGLRFVGENKVEIGFAVKHPFADITKRPDLHGFDVRGIIITNGNYNFPQTQVALSATQNTPARANVSFVTNPHGYTHHFVEIASDPNYFNPPKNYNVNINPYRRYFENGEYTNFDPKNPSGYNVMKVGADWETQRYILNLPTSPTPVDFVFVVDCAYGQSATFQNRNNPYYFLPEFNRKEAWKVEMAVVSGTFQAGNTSSSVNYQIKVCDWQRNFEVDENYPDINNLDGIKYKSDVAKVSIEIPFVSGLVEKTTPDSGLGTSNNPYVYNINVKNSLGAKAGWYYGIIAVRDDLQGQQGPIAIPPSSSGFPYPGPEIYDYSTYYIFQARVHGSPPQLVPPFSYPSNPKEGEFVQFNINVTEPDGDSLTYKWEQISPSSPKGTFQNDSVEDAIWQAPPLYDVPLGQQEFQIRITVYDMDGSDSETLILYVWEINNPPICDGIYTSPFYGVIGKNGYIDMWVNAWDPDGDSAFISWDIDWDGDMWNFDEDYTDAGVYHHHWDDQGFYLVGCKLTEERLNPLTSYYSRVLIQEGAINDVIKVDDSPLNPDPNFVYHDVVMIRDIRGNPTYHVSWIKLADYHVYYTNNAGSPRDFVSPVLISNGPPSGGTKETKVVGNGPIVHVLWIESDTSVSPTKISIKINSSTDYGLTFGAMGGERIIGSVNSPNNIESIDVVSGQQLGQFFMFVIFKEGTNYVCKLLASYDGGMTWDEPPSGGVFRDAITSMWADSPDIEVTSSGVIHVFWRDNNVSPPAYYYDYSEDWGNTWQGDKRVSFTQSYWGAMAVDENNNAYFVWNDNTEKYYFRKSKISPFSFSSPYSFITSGSNIYYGSDIWVSPTGGVILIPIIYEDITTSKFSIAYYCSFDFGAYIKLFDSKTFDSTDRMYPKCAGAWDIDPNRAEIFVSWLDERISLAPFGGHVYGDFVYIAERF